MSEKYRDEEWLRQKYVEENLGVTTIGRICDVSPATISKQKDSFGLVKNHQDKDVLRDLYRYQNMGPTQISEHFEYDISPATIHNWVERFDIEKRHRDEEWLREKYVDEGMSSCSMADICDVCPQTVLNNLHKHNIETVDVSDRWDEYDSPLLGLTGEDHPTYGMCGSDHPLWNVTGEDHPTYIDGSSSSDWRNSVEWKHARQRAIEVYDNTCQNCGIKNDIHVHHITPVCYGGSKYDIWNLTCLCGVCHRDVHSYIYTSSNASSTGSEWITDPVYN